MPKALRRIKESIKHSSPSVLLSLYDLPKDPWEQPVVLHAACEVCSYLVRQFYFDNFECAWFAAQNH
jgi:hypothetical protein